MRVPPDRRGVAHQTQYYLGAMYADGHGVPLDYVEAYKWLSVAATRFQGGSRDAEVEMCDQVVREMTSSRSRK